MCHEERRHPEGRDPVRRPHVHRGAVRGSQPDSHRQIQRPFDVEHPHQDSPGPVIANDRHQRGEGQHGGDQVAQCRGVGELGGDAGIGGAPREEHQPEVAEGMQQKNRRHHAAEAPTAEFREHIYSGGGVEDQGARDEIDGEDPIGEGLQSVPLNQPL